MGAKEGGATKRLREGGVREEAGEKEGVGQG